MMKTLLLQAVTRMQAGTKFISGQDHNTLGILMISHLLHEVIQLTATVRSLTRRVKRVGHEFYMGNFFFSPNLSDYLHTRGINCYETIKIINECFGSDTKIVMGRHTCKGER
jgi:hypothetical protein